MIGSVNESYIFINGQKCTALIDAGSVVTTICEEFYNSMNPRPELRNMSDFELNIAGASGSSIPYLGYIEAQVSMFDIDNDPLTVPVLVVPTTRFSGQVPIIVGTNIIAAFRDHVIIQSLNLLSTDTSYPNGRCHGIERHSANYMK